MPISILFVVGFSIYAFNFHNRLFWDDDDWIVNNAYVHDFSHVKEIFTKNILSGFGLNSNYYRPLLLLSFAFNYVINGVTPFGYHLLSNGFHIANGILIFLLLLYAFKRKLPAFLAALLFLIHPLQTEAVTYVSGRGDPMSVFFMLLALWLFIKTVGNQTFRKWICLALSLVSMILAILSRETAVLLPALLMVFYIAFLSDEKFWKSVGKSFIRSLPYWGITIIYGILRLTVLNFKNTLNFYSQANEYTQHLSYRLYTFGHALFEYFKLIFAPLNLHMERNLPVNTSFFQWPVWLVGLAVLGLLVLLWVLYKKRRPVPAHNPNFKVWFFAWAWFFVSMAPVSGIVPINALMYEHWLYLPLIGLFALAGFYLDKLFSYAKSKSVALFYALAVILAVYFCFFAVVSIQRNILWGKPVEFYNDILKYDPTSVRILNNLGNTYSAEGDLKNAADAYQKAILSPDGSNFAQPYYNLGNVYRDMGNTGKATEEYKNAIKIDPNFPFAYQNLAVIYANQGDLNNAALMLEKVKELKPSELAVYYNLGLVYMAQNKKDLAAENFNIALKLSANNPQITAEIKTILEKLGK